MLTQLVRRLPCISGLAVAVLPLAAVAQSVSLSPPDTSFVMNPGETRQFTATVCMPGQYHKADVYVLIDTTPSMAPVIQEVRGHASQIVNSLLSTPGFDLEVGIGTYRDFPFDEKPFDHMISPTGDAAALVSTINGLSSAGGGDGSECQFYALQQLATDPAIGFRPDAKRIILWFGDSPGHDPICGIFVGFGEMAPEITEQTAIAALQAAGPGGTSVIAISTPTGYQLGLNDDPLLFAGDYAPFCEPGGTPGQADRVAAGTGGISTYVAEPAEVTQKTLETVSSLLTTVDLRCELTSAMAPFVKSINPPNYLGVVLPDDPQEFVCRDFDVLLEAPPCPKVCQLSPGDFIVRSNEVAIETQLMYVREPPCKPMQGLIIVGLQALVQPVAMKSQGPEDALRVVPMAAWKAMLDTMSPINIPDNPALEGFKVYVQCVARNKHAFPGDPVKVSNGLLITLGSSGESQAFSPEGGLKLWMEQASAGLGSQVQLLCGVVP